jgi:carbonic anhydrase/acetyltransferase-like protein (isoleucine patch superfamily)
MSEKKESKLFSGSGPVKLSSSEQSERIKSQIITEQPESQEIIEEKPEEESTVYDRDANVKEPVSSGMLNMSTISSTERHAPISSRDTSPIESNIATSWSPTRIKPMVDSGAYVHPRGLVIGNVIINSGVFIAPFTSVRGDEDEPIFIGRKAAILEGTIVNSLPTRREGKKLAQRLIRVGDNEYPIYISHKVTVSQGVKIHGPAYIGSNTFIGMGALIFWAKIGMNCVIEPGALVINAEIPDGRFVPAGLSVTSQKIVQSLPMITSKYRFESINKEMLDENQEIVRGYLRGG